MLLLNTSGVALGAPGEPPAQPLNTWRPITVYHDPNPTTRHIPAPESFNRMSRLGVQTATIHVTYLGAGQKDRSGAPCLAWPAGSQAAFEYAVDIWETTINSTVPIEVVACWSDALPAGVLGRGGPDNHYINVSGGTPGTIYPTALANALAGSRMDGSTVDMHLTYASEWDWYFGTDGNPGASQIDLVSIVLHEACHGLGFSGSMIIDEGLGYWTWGDPSAYPTMYDRLAETGSGTALLSLGNGSAALANALTSNNIYFNGTHATAANGGAHPELFAPATWMQGSSYVHLAESFNTSNGGEDALMTYSFADGESVHAPGPVTLGVMQDVGWTLAANTAPTLSGIPDVMVAVNRSGNNLVDLWQYAADAETADASLTFSFVTTPPADAGITIDANRYIDVTPAIGYVNDVTVEVQVADPQGLTASDTFQVNITDENFAPTLTIPNISLSINENRSVDLRPYVDDFNDADEDLTFVVESVSAADLTATISSGYYLDLAPTTDWEGTATVEVSVTDPGSLSDTATFNVKVSPMKTVYLPFVGRIYPPVPGSLTLNAISNADGDGSYTVSWGSAERADTYVLWEANNAAFSSATKVYEGASQSWNASGKAPGVYYYRARGKNSDGGGPWSNTQSVLVVPPPKVWTIADATVFSNISDSNYGTANILRIGYDNPGCSNSINGGIARSLIQFDLSSVPASSAIVSAKLYLYKGNYCVYSGHEQPRNIVIHRLGSPWTETSVTWNSQPAIFEVQGGGAIDVTGQQYYQFDITALVQGWVNGSLPNYGLVLVGPETTGDNFVSFDFGAFESGSDYEPYLEMTYAGMAQQTANARVSRPMPAQGCQTFRSLLGLPEVNVCGEGQTCQSITMCTP